MNRTTLIDGTVFIVIGAVCIAEARHLSIVSDPNALHQELRPGLYVFLLGLVLLGAGVVHLIAHLRSARVAQGTVSRETRVRLTGMVLALAAYAVLIELVGYLAASVPFFLLVFRLFGVRSWPANIGLSALVAAVFYVVFVKYCDVIFPHGVLFG